MLALLAIVVMASAATLIENIELAILVTLAVACAAVVACIGYVLHRDRFVTTTKYPRIRAGTPFRPRVTAGKRAALPSPARALPGVSPVTYVITDAGEPAPSRAWPGNPPSSPRRAAQ